MEETPEQRLMREVLRDALDLIFLRRNLRAESQWWETMRWVLSYNDPKPFSFNNVCTELRISSDWLRNKIAAANGITLSPRKIKPVAPPLEFRQHGARADETLDWCSMYQLGSSLYMGGYRERPVDR